MSIFKETFANYVKKQLEQREKIISSGAGRRIVTPTVDAGVTLDSTENTEFNYDKKTFFNFNEKRSNEFFQYQQKQCTIRLSSGVNIIDPGLLDEGLTGAQIAERWVLEGGIKDENTNRGGIGTGGAYGDPALRANAEDGYGIVPMPGITGVNIRTKSAYGSLREAKVNFVCHNRRQLEILELLYMRPGYTLLLEWQWSPFVDNEGNMDYNTVKSIDFFNSSQTTAKMEGQIQVFKEETGGNYDALVGYCKNFTYKLRADGGFECETELIAKGDIIESLTDKETSIRFKDGATSRFTSRPNIELFLSQIITLNDAVENIGGLTSGNEASLSSELKPKIGLTEIDSLSPYILTGGSAAYTTFKPSATDDFWGRGIQDTDEIKGEGTFWGMGKRTRTSTTWIRWDAFCHFLNKEVIPLDEHKIPLCEFTTAYITSPDKDSQVKFKPLLYSSKFVATAHLTSKITSLRGFLFNEENQNFKATNENNKIQFQGLCDISTNNQICMLPHNLKAYDYLTDYEKKEGSTTLTSLNSGDVVDNSVREFADYFSKNTKSDFVKEGILKKSFFKPLIDSLAEKNQFKTVRGFGKARTWTENDSESIQNIGGIYFGAEYLMKKFKEDYYDSEGNINKDFAIFKYIKEIWEEVNATCVDNHDFDLQTINTPGGKIISVIDRQMDNSYEKIDDIYTLKIQSLDSVVQDITYNTTIPSSLSSTIAIAAQAPDSIDDLDKVSFAALNKGIKDRFAVSQNVDTTPSSAQIKEWQLQHQAQLIHIYDAMHIPAVSNDEGFDISSNDFVASPEYQTYRIYKNIQEQRRKADEVGGGGTLRILLYRWYQESKNYILKEDSDSADIESTSTYKGAVKNVKKALNFFETHYGSTNETEGYWVGQPATDSHSPLSAIIPLKFNAKLDGISGIKIGNVFKLPKDRLPLAYNGDDIHFIVMGEEQNIDENQKWTTTISGHLVLLGNVNSEEYIKSKHYKSWQEPYLQITADAYSNSPELIGTSTVDDYEPGSKTFDPWPNSELGDPLKTMFITSDFGPRTIKGKEDKHGGIDLRYHSKDEKSGFLPFYAVGTGIVSWDGDSLNNVTTGCGGTLTLILERDPINLTKKFSATNPYAITYCHVKKFLTSINSGDRVAKGDIIGYVGGDKNDPGRGNSTTRHLHMTYRAFPGNNESTKLNPAKWLPGIGGEQADGSKELYNYEWIDAMPGRDTYNNLITKPLEGKTTFTFFRIKPGKDERKEAMENPNKKDELEWYLVRDGYYKQTGLWNNQQSFIRISKASVGAKVLDSLSDIKYDPSWFTSGGNLFDGNRLDGKIPYPTYNNDEFDHDICNFPTHMHYTKEGKQIPPNEAANWFSEYEVKFSNDVGPNNKTTISGGCYVLNI